VREDIHNYRALDAYRFFAALAVAFGHFNHGFNLGLDDITPLSGRFGLFVDFFFILSGFVIALNYQGQINQIRSYGDFLWRRVARLWPLHIAVLVFLECLVFGGWLIGYQYIDPTKMDLKDLPWNIMMMQAWGPVWHQSFNVVAWSVSAEFFVYLLFPLLAWQAKRLPLWFNLAFIVVYFTAENMIRTALGLGPWALATYDFGMLRAVPSFLLGILIFQVIHSNNGAMKSTWVISHALFLAAILAIHSGLPGEVAIACFGAFVFSAALAEESQPDTWLASPLCNRLGQASYALYMIHMPLMTCALFILRKTVGTGGVVAWVSALGVLALGTVLSIWLYTVFENPARRWLNARSLFRREKPVADRRPAPAVAP
jgi:peptidoglycan/LPS O-acetylase OafA/YrhL